MLDWTKSEFAALLAIFALMVAQHAIVDALAPLFE
jgi:hypothetical protein